MRRLFLGIYGAILFSILSVLVFSYFALESLNQYRYQQHLLKHVSGTAYLLGLGVERQQGENQRRWLSLVSSLLETKVNLEENHHLQQPAEITLTPLKSETGEPEDGFTLSYPMPETNNRLVMEVEGLSEKLMTTTAFLLLNELGRHDVAERQQIFDNIRQRLSYSASRRQSHHLALDTRQLGRLQRGETIVEWDKQYGRGFSLNIYAPWGSTRGVLALGPIAFFDPYPTHLVAMSLIVALILMAISVMLIIRHLARRIHRIQDEVDAIGTSYQTPEEGDIGTDAIAQLNGKIQNMAQRIEKLLGEKAYMIRAVSHDLRTPIAKLHFRMEGLAAQLDPDNSMLEGCRKDLHQLNDLIDELLNYEKLSMTHEISFESLSVCQLIEEQVLSIEVCFSDLSFNVYKPGSLDLKADISPVLFGRLLENLLNNAGRYAKSKVDLYIRACNECLYMTIEDDGPGLPDGSLNRLFDPFYQADESRNSESGGYGLGLAIVKQVATQHGGKIEGGNHEQGGARFTLTIPLKQQQKVNNNEV